jgi:hypothetical protein
MTILIDVAAEFTGKKAFKQAESATDKLTKSAKTLGKTLGISLGAAAVLGFAKASVKAAAADQKAQQQLALALKNVGLGRDAATAEGYIQRLQSEFGIVDDKLRPAYQILAIATRDTAESQRLMGIAMDVSAASGIDLQAVSKALSKAYLGNNTALSKLGVGISKADLKSKSFKEITDQLSLTFAGAATTAASGYQGSLDKLAVAANNVKEIIGIGLLDALTIVSGDQGLGNATTAAEKYAQKISDATVGTAYLIEELKKLPGASFALKLLSDPLGINSLLNAAQAFKQQPRPFKTGMSVSGQVDNTVLSNTKKVTVLTKEQSKAQAKILADKKLSAAIDKANLALNKGTDLFNMDAIQLNAALINQADQLGKVTSQAQLLAITNDITRLKIKQDIIALEDAIASKDEAAITAATNKLNKDLLILGALQNQSLKLADIKSILDTLLPKDLINLANLNEAIRLLTIINNGKTPSVTNPVAPVVPVIPVSPILGKPIPVVGIPGVDYNPGQNPDRNISNGFPNGVTSGAGITYNPNQQGDRNYDIKIYANTIANPDELSGLIQDTIIRLNKQGDYITTAGAL